jgi:L-fuconate dehydratase
MAELAVIGFDTVDVRFPTSLQLDGSDAMNPDPDYSAAYVILRTNDPALEGHGFCFTIGRGTEVCVQAIRAVAPMVVGDKAEALFADMGGLWRRLVGDSQLRWLGPEKGVIHLATAAVVNAVWDMWARAEGKPLWRLVAGFTPEQFVKAVPFQYLTDAIDSGSARELLEERAAGKDERRAEMERDGFPAYTTSAGWLGYTEEEIRRLAREAVAEGWNDVKMKVGGPPDEDARRAQIIREEIGMERRLMMDANQVWDVPDAIEKTLALKQFEPYWMEEPTSPDDALGHAAIAEAIAPIKVATGEHCMNRVLFKQLMQANAIGVCQVDACRLGGVNEVLAVLLLAAHFGVPVCPHSGGVGLCELTQHLSIVDYVCVGASLDGRLLEYVDHLHEHFVDPVRMRGGRYLAPQQPGYSAQMKAESLDEFEFPGGAAWRS